MYRTIISFAAMFLIALSSRVASACSMQPAGAPASYNPTSDADVVFTGVAIKTRKRLGDFSVTVFRVSEKKKGLVVGKMVTVKHRTRQNGCQMSVKYKPYKEYIVYAKRKPWGKLYIKQPSYMIQ